MTELTKNFEDAPVSQDHVDMPQSMYTSSPNRSTTCPQSSYVAQCPCQSVSSCGLSIASRLYHANQAMASVIISTRAVVASVDMIEEG